MMSPSSLDRRALCPGSERMETLHPQPKTGGSVHAIRGTNLHKIMHDLCENGISPDVELGSLSAEDDTAVRFCWDTIKDWIDNSRKAGHLILAEHQLDMTSLGMNVEEDPERCRVDLAIIDGENATLIDWKFGEAYTPRPKYSWQFKAYATGLAINYGVKTVKCVRIQPANSEDHRVVSDIFTEDDFRIFSDKLKGISSACQDINASLVTGQKQCVFCSAKEKCPARSGAIMGLPMHMGVRAYLEQSEPQERSDFYEKLMVALDWATKAKAEVDGFILEGGTVNGFGTGPGRGTREWRSEAEAQASLRELSVVCGVNPDSLLITKLASPAQAEKILGTSKATKAKIAELVQTSIGNPKVVRLDKV